MAATQQDRPALRLHAVVAAEQSLIVDAVCAALGSSGFDSHREPWPSALPSPRLEHAEKAHTAGLLVCELQDWSQIRAAGMALRRRTIPWAVLTSAPPGPLWGAVYEHDARLVVPATTPLEEVVTILTELAERDSAGGVGGLGDSLQQRLDYQRQWRELCERRADLRARARALTPREREVLMLLYDGATIANIAALLQISPSTVRSQVKAVRQKLGVTSQLAAVAAYGSLIRPDPGRPMVRS